MHGSCCPMQRASHPDKPGRLVLTQHREETILEKRQSLKDFVYRAIEIFFAGISISPVALLGFEACIGNLPQGFTLPYICPVLL